MRALSEYTADLGRARRGGKLAPATISRRLAAVRSLLRFSLGRARVPEIPLAPRRSQRLPDAPKAEEVDELLAALDPSVCMGTHAHAGALALRNRALVELVYSAGLRSAEAVGLDLADVDFEQEHVHVRHGQGREGARRPARRGGGLLARALPARVAARSSRAEPRTPCSSRRAAAGSTPRRFAA